MTSYGKDLSWKVKGLLHRIVLFSPRLSGIKAIFAGDTSHTIHRRNKNSFSLSRKHKKRAVWHASEQYITIRKDQGWIFFFLSVPGRRCCLTANIGFWQDKQSFTENYMWNRQLKHDVGQTPGRVRMLTLHLLHTSSGFHCVFSRYCGWQGTTGLCLLMEKNPKRLKSHAYAQSHGLENFFRLPMVPPKICWLE